MIRSRSIAQVAFGYQAPGQGARAAGDGLGRKAFKIPGRQIQVEPDTIDIDGLADIARNDIGIVAAFFQVIIGPFGGAIGQV